jgi:hypothetical protein
MAEERIIWQPNEIPLEEWEAMSRADQINWWKSRQAKTLHKKPHMKRAIDLYNKGTLTETGFFTFVATNAVPKEIEQFVKVCPPDLLAKLKEYLTEHGEDEQKWPRTYSIRTYFPWVTPEEIEETERREQEQLWNGVRLLKAYFHR